MYKISPIELQDESQKINFLQEFGSEKACFFCVLLPRRRVRGKHVARVGRIQHVATAINPFRGIVAHAHIFAFRKDEEEEESTCGHIQVEQL